MITQNKIKTVLILATVLAVFAAFGGPLQAAVVLYEPFDYPVGALDGVTVNSLGMTGTWSAGSNTTIEANSLWWGGDLPTSGNKLDVATVHQPLESMCEAPLDTTAFAGKLDDGDVLWFSMLVGTKGSVTENALWFRIGNDADNNVGFYVDQGLGQLNGPHITRVRALATVDGVESLAEDYPTGDYSWSFWVLGKITFGATDKVELWLPAIDQEIMGQPVSTIYTTLDQTTFDWLQVDQYNGNSSIRCDEIRIGETYTDVEAIIDPLRPVVNAGVDKVNWSGNTLQLAADAEDKDPVGVLTYAWVADPNTGIEFTPYGTVLAPDDKFRSTDLNPTVTITRGTGDPTVYALTLAVNNVDATRTDTVDTMTIDLYDNACDAAILGTSTASFALGDLDEDCLTGLEDFAAMSELWEDDYTIPAPVAKPIH